MAIYGGQVRTTPYQAPDYGPSVAAARELAMTGAQGIAGMVGQVGDYFKQQGEKKKAIKQSDVQIDAALKLFPDLTPALQGYRDQLKDENLPLDDRMAIADSISKVIDLGIGEMRNAQKTLMERQRLGMEAEYKQGMLEASQMRAGASVLNAKAAAQPNYTFQEYNVKNPLTGEDEKSKLPVNPKTGRPRDIEANRDILNVQDWYENKGGLAPEEPAMPTPTSQVMPSNGAFGFTYKTRDLLPASSPTNRQISLDFNAAPSKNAKGIEIIIPNNATEEERQLAQEYVAKTQQYFAERGVNVPARGVRTAKENGRGTPNRFHTEPFFVGDAASRAVMEKDPDGYARVLASTLGRIPGAMFIPPHKSNDPGASDGKFNERDFAKSSIIPALERLSKQKSAQASPAGIDNAISMTGDMTQQAMGTPQQQAEIARMIEEGQGMAMAQNVPQGAMPTEPSMATQQPQLPQQAAPKVNLRPGFAPVRTQGNKPTTTMTAEQVQNLAAQGYRVNAIPNADGSFDVSGVTVGGQPGLEIEQTPNGGFKLVQGAGVGGRYGQAAQERQKQQTSRSAMGVQDAYRALRKFDAEVMKGSGVLASSYKKGAQFLPGTPEHNVAQELIRPLKDSIAKESLDAMRASSPSGGALGNSSNADIDLLKSRYGALEIETDPVVWRQNLTRFIEAQLDVIHGTTEQRKQLVQEGKLTKEQYFDIESQYPAFTMSATGETVPRQMDGASPQGQPVDDENTRIEAILRQHGVIPK